MEINKKNRTELKNYFLANKIPTQKHFEDFVESSLNQAEDGIAKVQGSPIALQAEGDAAGTQEVLNLFSDFADDKPGWSINLNPRVDSQVPTSNKPGLNIKNEAEETQFFIKGNGGDVGIGTIEPNARLSIQARQNPSLISVISETTGDASIFEVAQENNHGVVSVRASDGTTMAELNGDPTKTSYFKNKVGIGTETAEADLHLKGNGAQLLISNTQAGQNAGIKMKGSNNKGWDFKVMENDFSKLYLMPDGAGETGFIFHRGGRIETQGGISFTSRSNHLNDDGSIYMMGDQLYLAVDDNFYIRDVNGSEKIHFQTNHGRMAIGGKDPLAPISILNTGKNNFPNSAMHISNNCILFGGPNAGKQQNSGKIAAGLHIPNSLNIVGMASNSSSSTRRVDVWAENGMRVNGWISQTKVVAFAANVSSNSMTGTRNPMPFGSTSFNHGGAFSHATNKFTAPIKGIYMFTMTLYKVGGGSSVLHWLLRLNTTGYVNGKSGSELDERARLTVKYDGQHSSRTVTTILNAGDTVHVHQGGSGRPDNYRSGFEGVLLHALPE